MASHSLTVGFNVGNAGRNLVFKDASRSTTGKHVASPNTRGAIVSSSPIDPTPDVLPVLNSEFAMGNTSNTPPTSQAYGRNLRLPVSPKSVLKSLVMGLALFAKGVSALNIPNCTGPAEGVPFYESNICGPGNSYINGCNISSNLQSNMNALYENSPFRVNGTNVLYPNMTGVNLTEFHFGLSTYLELVELQSAGTVNGCNDQGEEVLQDYCLPYVCKVYNDYVELVGKTLAPSSFPTSFVEPEEVIKLSVGNASLGSLGVFIFYQLLLLGIDMCFSRSQKVEEDEQVGDDGRVIRSTLDIIKDRIGAGDGTDFQKRSVAKEIVTEYLKDINHLKRKYFVKNYGSIVLKVALGCVSAFRDANSDECSYDKQPSSMISNYFLMGAAAEFLFSKLDQRFWSEQCSKLITNSRVINTASSDGNLANSLAEVLVKATDAADDKKIEQFIDIVHSPVQLADMGKMWAHVVPILFSVCLFSATDESFSTCEDNQFNKELYWGLPLALVLFKGVLDVFCYPTELSVQKKSELKRFANEKAPIRQQANVGLGNSQELQPLMTVHGSTQDDSNGDLEVGMPSSSSISTSIVNHEKKADEIVDEGGGKPKIVPSVAESKESTSNVERPGRFDIES
jgi:hypothetical protein